mmetsp:Transcript_27489/g.88763  ORF Transcript_27489/g.88763 Transcript_27489/m.88763 type:complete len:230 (-) Transcript_27489:581-1270(-)
MACAGRAMAAVGDPVPPIRCRHAACPCRAAPAPRLARPTDAGSRSRIRRTAPRARPKSGADAWRSGPAALGREKQAPRRQSPWRRAPTAPATPGRPGPGGWTARPVARGRAGARWPRRRPPVRVGHAKTCTALSRGLGACGAPPAASASAAATARAPRRRRAPLTQPHPWEWHTAGRWASARDATPHTPQARPATRAGGWARPGQRARPACRPPPRPTRRWAPPRPQAA